MPDSRPTSLLAGLFSTAPGKFISTPLIIIVRIEIESEFGIVSQ
jgi:hypothetical protein